jgi:hypothetical protein
MAQTESGVEMLHHQIKDHDVRLCRGKKDHGGF